MLTVHAMADLLLRNSNATLCNGRVSMHIAHPPEGSE